MVAAGLLTLALQTAGYWIAMRRPAVDHEVRLKFDRGFIEVSAPAGGDLVTRWTCRSQEQVVLFRHAVPGALWLNPSTFMTRAGSEAHGLNARLKLPHSSRFGIVGPTHAVLDLSELLPIALPALTRVTTTVDCGVRSDHISWVPDRDQFAAVGLAAAVVPVGELHVVALDEADVVTANKTASVASAIVVRGGEELPKFLPSLIVASEDVIASASGRETRDFLSNLIVGPFADRSTVLEWRICSAAVATIAARTIGSRLMAVAASMAVGDSVQQQLFGSAAVTEDRFAVERALAVAAELGLCSDEHNSSEDQTLDELRGAIIYAPFLRRALSHGRSLERSASIAEHLAHDVRAIEIVDLNEAIRKRGHELPVSPIRGHLSPSEAVSGDPCIEIAAGMYGYLEDCGCKSATGGGLKRLVRRWVDPAMGGRKRLILGNMLALPDKVSYSNGMHRFILSELRDSAAVHGYVPGCSELYALSTGALEPSASDGWICCNARLREGPTPWVPWLDMQIGQSKLRVVGLTTIPCRLINSRRREIIVERVEFEDLRLAVEKVLAVTPPSMTVILAGTCDPADLAWLAELSDARDLSVVLGDSDFLHTTTSGAVEEYYADGMCGRYPVVFSKEGRYGVLTVELCPKGTVVRGERIRLTEDVPTADPVSQRVRRFLESTGDSAPIELAFPEPLLGTGARYVGSAACAECHRSEHAHWLETPHANAVNTLRRVQRHRVANCVACHVVGYGLPSGYDLDRPEDQLGSVGCEVCHGPGSLHVRAPSDRASVRRSPSDELCSRCHSMPHSVFLLGNQQTFRARIDHKRKHDGTTRK